VVAWKLTRIPLLVFSFYSYLRFLILTWLAHWMITLSCQIPDESQLDMPLDDHQPLRLRDMVFSATTPHETMSTCLQRIVESAKNSSGLIINTFSDLEDASLRKIADGAGVQVYAIGPLHKISGGAQSSLLAQDRTCLDWLDKQEAASVLYVSFGSLASMDSGKLWEVAWGLANSGQPFLWVVRPDLVRGSDGTGLPEGFDRAVDGRGKVIPWAPQQEVLAHPAVGGFWTHNGWNSTLESITEGLPMICRPQFADQMMNTRYVETEWGVGFELEGELERNKIEEAIRNLMSHGDVVRESARELKKKVATCLESGGSSVLAIDKLIDYISSL
jgi:UDP:flavonoid glycosyltransferase YjiC (YdhE family)